jgi:hypothetical protein
MALSPLELNRLATSPCSMAVWFFVKTSCKKIILGVVVIGWWGALFNNQRAACGYGLEAYVAVIEISSCHADGNMNFAVKEVIWWHRPL